MDNKAIANILYETADLLEIDGQDSFRIRSYRNAAQAIENHSQQIKDIISDPKQVLAIPGIGKGMLDQPAGTFQDGQARRAGRIAGEISPVDAAIAEDSGTRPQDDRADLERLQGLRCGWRRETRARRKNSRTASHGRKARSQAAEGHRRLSPHRRPLPDRRRRDRSRKAHRLHPEVPGIDKITPAGSLRRGRETVGDLDILVTGKPAATEEGRQEAIDLRRANIRRSWTSSPAATTRSASTCATGMQVDVRLLPPESFGAAMQYFTGSKAHNVALRQRALKMGYTLNEYSLATLEGEKPVAGKTEEEIYAKLKLDYIPPEMRENLRRDRSRRRSMPCPR